MVSGDSEAPGEWCSSLGGVERSWEGVGVGGVCGGVRRIIGVRRSQGVDRGELY